MARAAILPRSHGPEVWRNFELSRAVFDGQLRMERVGGQFMLKLLGARNCRRVRKAAAVQGNER